MACGNGGTPEACGGGNGGGIGLRAGATAGRDGRADILGRGLRSEALVSEALASEVLTSETLASETLAMSRDICSWLALSCSISCLAEARSRAID